MGEIYSFLSIGFKGFRVREQLVGDQRFSEDIELSLSGTRLVALGLEVPL